MTAALDDGIHPTVADVLALPELARGRPRVVAGVERLDRPVRWVHISEHHDIARLMYGGELVLTTGVAWPDDTEARVRFIEDLADAGAVGVVIELVRLFHEVPRDMIAAADRRGLPLIGLEREIRFIDVTQAVHAAIIDTQLTELRVLNAAQERMMKLGVEGAPLEEILGHLSEISGRPAVLENVAHQVTCYAAADMTASHLLGDWEPRSRRAGTTEDGPGSSWLVADVRARGQRFGRLLLVADDAMPAWAQRVLDLAAMTVALRLVERDAASLERHAHGGLLSAIIERSYTSDQWLQLRAESLGVPIRGRRLVGLLVAIRRPDRGAADPDAQAASREDAETVANAVRDTEIPALVGPMRAGGIAVLLSFPRGKAVDPALDRVARAVHRSLARGHHPACTIGVGSAVDAPGEARRSLLEAEHAAESVPSLDDDRLYYRLTDVGIGGLAHLLRDDPRLQTFVERMLQDLLTSDQRRGTDLEAALWAFLENGGNKSLAADSYGLSRPAFYARLAKIESVLGLDLGDAKVRTSLHFALLALQQIRSSAAGGS